MGSKRYPLAPQGVYRTVQGEGWLCGLPMTFVRLAGCSVGCAECDTDYGVAGRVSLKDLLRAVANSTRPGEWVWVTGGEPTDHDLEPLRNGLREMDFRAALATAGVRRVPWGGPGGWDFVSVSPHATKWEQPCGDELKLVAGLNGLKLADFNGTDAFGSFTHRYVCPCEGKPETVAECVAWVESHSGWRMGVQAHKLWRVP